MAPLLQTYNHTACSTLLLCTPHPLPFLPRRAPPSLDRAIILPLPPLTPASHPVLPSLLSQNLRPGRKVVVVRREDGFEKRREWRCGRCGGVVGYEIVPGAGKEEREGREREKEEGKEEGGRVMYFFEGALGGKGEGVEGVEGG